VAADEIVPENRRHGALGGSPRAARMTARDVESAPATNPATSEVTFNPAFAPLSVGTLRCSFASSRSPAGRARARTGTSPADDTRFGSSNTADVARGRVAELHQELPFVLMKLGS
jgi:hypothetical protein